MHSALRPRPRYAGLATLGALLPAVAGCATTGVHPTASSVLHVVAVEDTWGSIAAQLGGDRVEVTDLIANPAVDPHDYEPTPADARALADADVVVVNGVGYDTWAAKLLAVDPPSGRTVLTVGRLAGVPADGNPHRWYDPEDVALVTDALTAAYQRHRPDAAAYFAARHRTFRDVALATYHRLVEQLRGRYAGTPVGASESVFTPLAQALHLDLLTPPSFLKAVSEGTDPTAADTSAVQRQISRHQIAVYVYNPQNATPDVRAQVSAARAAGIPVTTVTETLTPATATFQDWQVRQLRALQAALAQGSRP